MMKKTFRRYLLYVILVIWSGMLHAQGGCDLLTKLNEDLAQAGPTLRPFFEDAANAGGKGVKAWKNMLDANVPTSLRTNIGALEALSLPKGSRPNPNTYLDAGYISNHLGKFDDGAVRFTTQSNIDNYGTLGPAEAFTMPKSEFDDLIAQTGGDLSQIESVLGLDAGMLTNGDAVIAWVKKEDFSGLKMPSGNEGGANANWIPGGVTSGGVSEAVLDLSNPNLPYRTFPF